MPTNDERRRLADNMRTFDVVGDARGRIWLNGTLFGMDICARSEETIRNGLRRLAAFVEPEPERTCRWVWIESWSDNELGRECDYANWALDCGCWDGWDRELHDFDDFYEPPREWDYCPRCGAKVDLESERKEASRR